MQFERTRLVVNGIALQVSLRFVLRHMIKPGDRVWRNAFHTPGLSGRQERLTRDILGSAHVVNPNRLHSTETIFLYSVLKRWGISSSCSACCMAQSVLCF